ncbi:hypothetical protein AJGP001_16500 [Planococcus faecalis]|uniref:Uncharacterized protein n=1 Tax=Planococcus faecalis TaxID=1598147 RepID=A0ABN4XM62_9BACL|nr:hypothetical protein AJGP001_16500 [Planococcus faecalis]OHX55777.1 hypothetical protein BB777_01075 [Planococcus faecalis]
MVFLHQFLFCSPSKSRLIGTGAEKGKHHYAKFVAKTLLKLLYLLWINFHQTLFTAYNKNSETIH